MVRFAKLFAVALALAAIVATAQARPEEKTLKGTITCAKCDLGKETKCATVITVKEGDKDVIYYFDKDGHSKYHKPICQASKEGTVTGTVSEKDGNKWITVSKLEWKQCAAPGGGEFYERPTGSPVGRSFARRRMIG